MGGLSYHIGVTPIATAAQMRAIEAEADRRGHAYAAMMDLAGRAVAREVMGWAGDTGTHRPTVVVLCGPGNNGGDGLVAAAALADAGMAVRVVTWRRAPDGRVAEARAHNVPVLALDARPDDAHADAADIAPSDLAGTAVDGTLSGTLSGWLADADVVVDALLGTGARGPLTGAVADLLARVAAAQPRFVVAVDLPTGLDADSGALDAHALAADLTVTFGCAKPGHVAFPGAAAVGRLVVDGIDIADDIVRACAAPPLGIVTDADVAGWLPPRPPDAHKGTFGRALVVAGSRAYPGAAALAAGGAYRAGCGLVTVAATAEVRAAVAAHLPEATFLPLPEVHGGISAAAAEAVRTAWLAYDAVLIGPGLSRDRGVAEFVRALLDGLSDLVEDARPGRVVVDADGLNLLADHPAGPRALPIGAVLTPHPGEMARLTGLTVAAVNADRVAVARRWAAAWRHVVVLKGAHTVVAAPDGRCAVVPIATSALAKAGTGDVLAGLIAGLLAAGAPPFEAAAAAVHTHALAGLRLAASPSGARAAVAGDLLAHIGPVWRGLGDASHAAPARRTTVSAGSAPPPSE
jgi:NAD(P)H-hydrate epimerase